MKNRILLVAFAFIGAAALFAQNTVTLDNAIDDYAKGLVNYIQKDKGVAVIAFKTEKNGLTEYLIDTATEKLFESGIRPIYERKQLEILQKELNYSLSGDVSDKTALRIGQRVGVNTVVYGTIQKIGNNYRINFRVANVETAQLIFPKAYDLQMDTRLAGLLGIRTAGNTPPQDQLQYDNENDFRIKPMDGKAAAILRYVGTKQAIRIPPQIQGLTVIRIEEEAFAYKELISVTIPNGVTYIDNGAFWNNQITSVSIPNSVAIIGMSAFQNNQLTSVTIPNSVIYINDWAFKNNRLIGVTIPNSVASIGAEAFMDNQLTSVTIPSSVTSIGDGAFANNQLHNAAIQSGVITIGAGAFSNSVTISDGGIITVRGNNKLTSVTIPNSVTSIGPYAFAHNQLTSAAIPNSVTSIGKGAFENNRLNSVTISDGVTTIGSSAFMNNQLTSVTIPNNVTTIGEGAFDGNQLTSVTIPDSVTFIGRHAFYGNQLTSVTIGNSVKTIREYAFKNNQLTNVTIPDSVTTIGDGAFKNNQLVSVTIPDGVTTIGDYAFENNQLTSVVIGINVTTIGFNAFTKNNISIVESKGKYLYFGQNSFDDNVKFRGGTPVHTTSVADILLDYKNNPVTARTKWRGKQVFLKDAKIETIASVFFIFLKSY